MIEKIKYCLTKLIASRRLRLGLIAVLTAATIAVTTLLSCSIYTVNIFDGENTYTIRTLNHNAAKVLKGITLRKSSYNIKNTRFAGRTTSFEISYNFPVYITKGDQTIELEFAGGTVKDALTLAGFTADEFDFVNPSLDTEVTETIYIDYTDIDYINGSYEETIPFKTENVYSNDLNNGQVVALRAGVNGVKQVSYTEKLVNGVSVEKTFTATTVLTEPVNAKQKVGTKKTAPVQATAVKTSADVKSISVLSPNSTIALDQNGNPVNYKSKMTVRATAYTYTGNNCATGVAPKPGYIAVNPKVIPYGTKLYIKSPDGRVVYGYAVAADTGGFIKKYPNGVDLFMSTRSECISFGVRNMEIYILD